MKWETKTLPANVFDALAAAGHAELVVALQQLRPADPVQALVLRTLADALRRFGLEGLQKAGSALLDVLDGKDGVVRDLADLRLASDTLATLQKLEAEKRSDVRDLITRLATTLGPVLAGVLKLVI